MDKTLNQNEFVRAFNRASFTYDEYAYIQKQVAKDLLDKISHHKVSPKVVVDLGCGTGLLTQQVAKRYPSAKIIGIDLAEDALAYARRFETETKQLDFVCADAASMPLADKSVDLIVSNCMLHWCADINAVLSEIKRVLKPNGLCFLSFMGPSTLSELKDAWARVDDKMHVHLFLDMHDVGDLLQKMGFTNVVLERDDVAIRYKSLRKALLDLKMTGTTNKMRGREKGLMGRAHFNRVVKALSLTSLDEGDVSLTYEVLYAHGFNALDVPRAQEVRVPLSSVTKRS